MAAVNNPSRLQTLSLSTFHFALAVEPGPEAGDMAGRFFAAANALAASSAVRVRPRRANFQALSHWVMTHGIVN